MRNPFRSDVLGDPDGLMTWMVVMAFVGPFAVAIVLWLIGAI